MAQPKRKKSKSRSRMRRASRKRPLPTVIACTECGADAQPHRVCPSCGYYDGRQVISVSVDD